MAHGHSTDNFINSFYCNKLEKNLEIVNQTIHEALHHHNSTRCTKVLYNSKISLKLWEVMLKMSWEWDAYREGGNAVFVCIILRAILILSHPYKKLHILSSCESYFFIDF